MTGKWYSGKIKRVRLDGTFDIDYDDGEQETRVDAALVRAIESRGSPGRSSSGGVGRLEEGAKVEGNYRGAGKWYSGKIKRVRLDGTFDIDYDDGEQETRVSESYLRSIGDSRDVRRSPERSSGGGRLEEGAKIECNLRGKGI